MAEFNRNYIEMFLGVVRKYMQVRGPMSQKDLATLTEVGVSTMSRFINQKTTELNPQLIAKITAKLNIPLHEIIDFVEEDYTDRFIRLVKFIKEEKSEGVPVEPTVTATEVPAEDVAEEVAQAATTTQNNDDFADVISSIGTAQQTASAKVTTGVGKKRTISFTPDMDAPNSASGLKEKLQNLSPRQKVYLTDFLNMDMEGRDFMVDVGTSLIRYIRQKSTSL
ncbi:MAG: helix-turn-helix transcriptional regulator [Bacteriovoracaceae bacterium]|nr:helix-turn-helix transcriptional regulator [Bacteriovoracaceae bacterium]